MIRWNFSSVFGVGLLGCLTAALPETALAGGASLKVCLQEDRPPYSFKFGKRTGGFDLHLSEELAKRLGRSLKVQWYETEHDEENAPKLEANAMLASRLCHLIGGYPLLASALGGSELKTFRLPDHDGQNRSERNKVYKLGVVVASKPYNRAVFATIVSPKIKGNIASLDELAGKKIVSEVATLPSILLMRHKKGILINNTSHITTLKSVFKYMDRGKADATLIGLHRFERYRFRNPETKLRFAGYISPLGFNLGFAALDRSKDLLAKVNKSLAEMSTDGTLKAIAKRNHITLVAPEKPDVMVKLRLP